MSSSVSAALNRAPAAARAGDRRFYTGMAVAAAAAVFLGFSRTFFLRGYFDPTPLAVPFVVHGAVFTAWIALFVTQTSLVAARRVAVHRKLGWAGAALAVAMIGVAMVAAVASGRRDIAAGYVEESLTFFATPVLSMAVFAALIAAAIALRGRAETHKRLMLLATLSLLDAAVARWPFPSLVGTPLGYYGIADAFILVAILYDFASRRSVSAVYVWGGLAIVAGQWLRDVLGATALWHAFATFLLN
ncbi:MAG TPA: hypothetical protein VFO94_10275 [Gammaproteobacteria bacterium]|nr:hypothetical protein [Gammaproteobacteria bacterium]